jgi:hypothetical protein
VYATSEKSVKPEACDAINELLDGLSFDCRTDVSAQRAFPLLD